MPREKIAARYAAAHVFVLPSYNEGMSVATLEAMASGLAVVVTPTGGTPELVRRRSQWADFQLGRRGPTCRALCGDLAHDRGLVRRMGEASRGARRTFLLGIGGRTLSEIFDAISRRFAASLPIYMEVKLKFNLCAVSVAISFRPGADG